MLFPPLIYFDLLNPRMIIDEIRTIHEFDPKNLRCLFEGYMNGQMWQIVFNVDQINEFTIYKHPR